MRNFILTPGGLIVVLLIIAAVAGLEFATLKIAEAKTTVYQGPCTAVSWSLTKETFLSDPKVALDLNCGTAKTQTTDAVVLFWSLRTQNQQDLNCVVRKAGAPSCEVPK